jgi:hypothetical protein
MPLNDRRDAHAPRLVDGGVGRDFEAQSGLGGGDAQVQSRRSDKRNGGVLIGHQVDFHVHACMYKQKVRGRVKGQKRQEQKGVHSYTRVPG